MDENMKNWVKKFGGWLPLLIVFVSILPKAYFIKTFASSGDDHLVASSILYGKMPFNESKIRITINDQVKPTYHSFPKKIARKLDSTGHLMPMLHRLHFLFPLYAVPNESTYAPLQFFLTAFLVRDTQSMFTNVVMGRLPSLLVHTFGLLLFLYLMVRYFKGAENTVSLCFSLLILSFSYEHLMYSFQMESYAIGIFGILLLAILYLYYLERDLVDVKSSYISIGLVCAMLMLMQYQLLFFSFAAVCGIVYYSIRRRVPFPVLSRRMFFSGLVFMFFFIPIFIMFLSKHTEHVGKFLIGENGPYTKYWFPGYTIVGWKDGIYYFIRFFSFNLLEVFRTMTYLFSPNSVAEVISFGVNFSLFAIGLIVVATHKNNNYSRQMIVFLLFSSLVWLIAVLSGRIALTPDRHCLILLPIFVFFIYFGSVTIGDFIEKSKLLPGLAGKVFLAVFLFTLLFSSYDFLSKRTEPLIIAGINESSVGDSSLIITNDRLFYLFSAKKRVPIFLDTKDKSRTGWLVSPQQKDFIPQRVYFILRDQINWIGDAKGQFDFEKSIDYLPEQIKSENGPLNTLFVSHQYKVTLDTVYTVVDDEVNRTFYKKRDERILILDIEKSQNTLHQ